MTNSQACTRGCQGRLPVNSSTTSSHSTGKSDWLTYSRLARRSLTPGLLLVLLTAARAHQAVTSAAVNARGRAPGTRRRCQANRPSQAVGAAANSSKTGTHRVGVLKAGTLELGWRRTVPFSERHHI